MISNCFFFPYYNCLILMVLLLGTNQMKTMCMSGGEEEGNISVKNVEYVARNPVC